jgi:hypothetical protein
MDADFHSLVNYFIDLVWIYKVQIIGSIFVSLAIFEYFYKEYLAKKRKQQIKQIKCQLQKVKNIIKVMSELNSDMYKDIQNVKEHEQIKAAIEGLRIQQSAGIELLQRDVKILDIKTDDILHQVKQTNGRVTELERGMSFINWVRKNKWYIGIFALAFMKVYETIPFKKFFDLLIRLLTTWI